MPKKTLNEELEIGQILQVAVDSISFMESNSTPGSPNTNEVVTEIGLKKPVYFDLVCEYGRNGRDKYLYCHSGERRLSVPLKLNDGRVAYLDHTSGFESIKIAKIELGAVIGKMYSIMASSSLEEVKEFAIYENVRERLNGLPFLSEKSVAELDQIAEEQTRNNKRREIIYSWYKENCINFNPN
jgi:hypothetical protein